LDTARPLLGKDVPDEHIRALLRRPVEEAVTKVTVLPATVRPKTPAETKESYVALAEKQIIDPVDAQWEMELHGVSINTAMTQNRRKQLIEIQAMINGREIRPVLSEDHGIHQRTIDSLAGSPEWLTLSEEIQERIMSHWILHEQAIMELASVQSLMQQQPTQQQPSPPAEAAQAPPGMASEPVGSAIQVM